MRRDIFFIILIILGGIAALCDVAFATYLGVTISSVLQGLSFLPVVFPTICIAVIAVNAVAIAYAVVYILLLRK
ncbi:MAG: hypothetical protein IJ033_01135 [Clostridia bacterium]|nr:hypothetical protein [Clostridia bacterium]